MQSSDEIEAAQRNRKDKRYGQGGFVTVRLGRSGTPITGSLFDVSAGGCLVYMETEVQFDSADVIEVRLYCQSLSFRALGCVRHTSDDGRTLGIQFHRLSQKDTADLNEFLSRLEAAAEQEILTTS